MDFCLPFPLEVLEMLVVGDSGVAEGMETVSTSRGSPVVHTLGRCGRVCLEEKVHPPRLHRCRSRKIPGERPEKRGDPEGHGTSLKRQEGIQLTLQAPQQPGSTYGSRAAPEENVSRRSGSRPLER